MCATKFAVSIGKSYPVLTCAVGCGCKSGCKTSLLERGMETADCFLCDQSARRQFRSKPYWLNIYECLRCGVFTVSEVLSGSLDNSRLVGDKRYILSHLSRTRWDDKGSPLELRAETVSSLLSTVSAPETIIGAIDRVLLYLSKRQISFAHRVTYQPDDFPLVNARDEREFKSLFVSARQLGYLDGEGEGFAGSLSGYRLSPSGWERARDLKSVSAPTNQAFMAMWFDDQMNGAWENGFQ